MPDSKETKKGVMLAFLGVLILSPDSLFVRVIDVPFYTLMFWRGLFMFLSLSLYLLYEYKKDLYQLWKELNKSTFLVSVLFVSSTFLFVLSLHHTSVAHTLLIVGTSPVFSAIFALIFLKESSQSHVWVGIIIIIAALTLIVQQEEQLVTIEGDIYALLSSIIMGYIFVHVRQYTNTHLILSLSLSGLWAALISLFLATEIQVSFLNGAMLLVLGTIVGFAFSLITLSARYIPAPVTGMFMPLETVLGVFLVWIVIDEQPSLMTIVGGLVIIMTLIVISFYEVKASKKT